MRDQHPVIVKQFGWINYHTDKNYEVQMKCYFFNKLMKYIFTKHTKILEGNQLLKMGMTMGET